MDEIEEHYTEVFQHLQFGIIIHCLYNIKNETEVRVTCDTVYISYRLISPPPDFWHLEGHLPQQFESTATNSQSRIWAKHKFIFGLTTCRKNWHINYIVFAGLVSKYPSQWLHMSLLYHNSGFIRLSSIKTAIKSGIDFGVIRFQQFSFKVTSI